MYALGANAEVTAKALLVKDVERERAVVRALRSVSGSGASCVLIQYALDELGSVPSGPRHGRAGLSGADIKQNFVFMVRTAPAAVATANAPRKHIPGVHGFTVGA